jgi:cyclomaltodextrinase / maltogenic alpha-amylase / neopullulanase
VVREAGFDSVTQYELWKAIWSSLNDGNFHELNWALRRHNDFVESFPPLTFIGNHDVTRIASQLERPDHLAHALVILLTVGGIPSIYAGDEFGYLGVKEERFGGDDAVRPEFGSPPVQLDKRGAQVWGLHQYLIGLRRRHSWLHAASTTALRLSNRHYVYQSRHGDDALIVALNIDDAAVRVVLAELGVGQGRVIAGSGMPPEEVVDVVSVEPHGWRILRPS